MEDIENYKKEIITFDLVKANFYAVFMIIPILLIYGVPFLLIWKNDFNKAALKQFLKNYNVGLLENTLIILLILTLGVVLHELIHGITWSLYTKKGFKSIKFGVLWKMLTPYCHCKEPLFVKHYIIGGIMPAIILGLIPAIYSIVSGNLMWFLFGTFFTLAAGGDFLIVSMLLKERMNSLVLDHPSEVGCFIYRKIKI